MVIVRTSDVNVILIDFPKRKGNEMVVPNEDGSYTIFINAGLNYEAQLKAYKHAIEHIENDDFGKSDVQEIEYSAHGLVHEEREAIPAKQYLQQIKRLQAERRKIKRQMKRDEERVQFIRDNCDMFRRAEHQYLYGDDL